MAKDVIVRCPLGTSDGPTFVKGALSLTEVLSSNECYDCRKVYVVAKGLGMLFHRGADIPIRSRLVCSSPGTSSFFTLSNICKLGHVLQSSLNTQFLSIVLFCTWIRPLQLGKSEDLISLDKS